MLPYPVPFSPCNYLCHMKRFISGTIFSLCCLLFISWGSLGHRTVATIAERHLTTSAKAAVADLLEGQSLDEVSTWADEIRSDPSYRKTAAWHFLNLPSGLNHQAFIASVRKMSQQNVVSSIDHFEAVLSNPTASKSEKTEALKFLVHFVGDIHQPMHVSHAEDKGGNTIQVRYNGKGSNLHAVWDSKILETEGVGMRELAAQNDHANVATVRQWQASTPEEWAWESYQISSRLYQEADLSDGRKLTDAYYRKYMPVVNERIEQAGIRLAGILNQLFKNYKPENSRATSEHKGDEVCDRVYSIRYFKSSGMTLLNLGAAYSNQKLTVVIKDDVASAFPEQPAKYFKGKIICVSGATELYKGKPQIVIHQSSQIHIR